MFDSFQIYEKMEQWDPELKLLVRHGTTILPARNKTAGSVLKFTQRNWLGDAIFIQNLRK